MKKLGLLKLQEKFNACAKGEYVIMGEMPERTRDYITVKHLTCGHVYKVRFDNFVSGTRCPNCYGVKKYTQEEIKSNIQKISNGEFEMIGDYVSTRHKIKLIHTLCGRSFETRYHHVMNGSKCPYCTNISKGELFIENVLSSLNLDFKMQVELPGCRSVQPLRFDFGIKINNEYVAMIEYDGEMHREPIYGENTLKKQQGNDKIKDLYCIANSIKLIRIDSRLSDDEIASILKEELNNYILCSA